MPHQKSNGQLWSDHTMVVYSGPRSTRPIRVRLGLTVIFPALNVPDARAV